MKQPSRQTIGYPQRAAYSRGLLHLIHYQPSADWHDRVVVLPQQLEMLPSGAIVAIDIMLHGKYYYWVFSILCDLAYF